MIQSINNYEAYYNTVSTLSGCKSKIGFMGKRLFVKGMER